MKRKIENYLNSRKKSEYDNLDKIFELYLNGNIKILLSEYVSVGIYPSFNKLDKTIQLNYNYQNIYVIIDFFEDKYNVVVYHAGIKVEELKKLFIECNYKEDFELRNLIKDIDEKIKNHPKLKDTKHLEKKKKIYSTIAWLSLCLPIVICGSIGLYCIINKNSVKGNVWWGMFFIVIPLIVWFIFYVKSKKLK